MTANDEREIAEVILRTRRHAFRDALPEILGAIRRITQRTQESRRGADRMIADYRAIISGRRRAPRRISTSTQST